MHQRGLWHATTLDREVVRVSNRVVELRGVRDGLVAVVRIEEDERGVTVMRERPERDAREGWVMWNAGVSPVIAPGSQAWAAVLVRARRAPAGSR